MKLEKLPLEFVSFFMPQRSSLTALHIYLFLHYIQNFGLLGEANTQVTNFKKKTQVTRATVGPAHGFPSPLLAAHYHTGISQ
jgi:hypothetical protein